jgi:Raf kinase inhibitor-like YbhB/YbcL family protein
MRYLILFFLLTGAISNSSLEVTSGAFTAGGDIPMQYTCEGENINPEITIKNIPSETRSLAIIMDDPDATNGTFVHWVMWNIPVDGVIKANSSPGTEGKNGRGENKYTGPCPPSGKHHYHFKIYALSTKLDLDKNSGKEELLAAMKGHILTSGELVGLYQKMKK